MVAIQRNHLPLCVKLLLAPRQNLAFSAPNKELNRVKGLPRLVVSIERSPARVAGPFCGTSIPCTAGR